MSKQEEDSARNPAKYTRARRLAGSAHGVEALENVDAVVLQDCVDSVLGAGDAIAFGVTKDGGAIAITIYSDGEAEKLYGGSTEELTELLEGIAGVARAT